MKIISNQTPERVVDHLSRSDAKAASASVVASHASLFGLEALYGSLPNASTLRLLLPCTSDVGALILGNVGDRRRRSQLRCRSIARATAEKLRTRATLRNARQAVGQSLILLEGAASPLLALSGDCSLTSEGLGLVPQTTLGFVNLSEDEAELAYFQRWFQTHWDAAVTPDGPPELLRALADFADRHPPGRVYAQALSTLFADFAVNGPGAVRTATGIRETAIWKKLFRFQKDAVIGAIEKLDRFGGCILADSVGLGKTFEALAVIKYFELRNDRVLVLTPKRLRDNWTLWTQNDVRNALAVDRFGYDVLNHTDLSRDGGLSGDLDLRHLNWGNYDLVVIDEFHNFRNRPSGAEHDSRYDRLMNWIIKAGVKTRVLMLSATPVNNRLNDLKNQIAFATEGVDTALAAHGIPSVTATVRLAQSQFNRWQALPDDRRTPDKLLDMLGFDYFRLLDLLTIARSRKHIEKYYGTEETGAFPAKLPPRNIYADADLAGAFPPIGDINREIRRLSLAAYAPLRYVLPNRRDLYERRYNQSVKDGAGVFRQLDREESLVALMRVNLLKRMESSVHAFALTIERQLSEVTDLIARIDAHEETIEAPDVDSLADDDPVFDELGVGRRVKVLLSDADLVRWRQDLVADRDRLQGLLEQARQVTPERDAKLAELKAVIGAKQRAPINPGNRKLLIFTAFAETAHYLYETLSPLYPASMALITGAGANRTNLPGLSTDLASLLNAFSPGSRGGAPGPALDIIIATDCISEGQNLQDCDTVVNYDIHWNPVRIVQRFGRVDRLGSPNACVQLINFWPNLDLDAYIGLQKSVSGKMTLLDVSATGEENIIEAESGDRMNDLEYRRRQLEALQSRAIDLEDISTGVSITDMTLNDLRLDYAQLPEALRGAHTIPTLYAPVPASEDLPPGALFLLRAETEAALATIDPADPLRPHALVYVGMDESVIVPHTNPKRSLDLLRLAARLPGEAQSEAWSRFDRGTHGGDRMGTWQRLLARALAAVGGKAEERAIDALFMRGGAGVAGGGDLDDWEVVCWLAILPHE